MTSVKVTIGDASQLSVEVGLPVITGSVLWLQRMVIFAGHVIAGATLSVTKIVWLQVLKLPQASVPFQVRVMV